MGKGNNMGKIDANTPIDNVGFSFRTRNTLRRAHIDTFKDLMAAYEEGNLRSIKNLGKVQYGESGTVLDSHKADYEMFSLSDLLYILK